MRTHGARRVGIRHVRSSQPHHSVYRCLASGSHEPLPIVRQFEPARSRVVPFGRVRCRSHAVFEGPPACHIDPRGILGGTLRRTPLRGRAKRYYSLFLTGLPSGVVRQTLGVLARFGPFGGRGWWAAQSSPTASIPRVSSSTLPPSDIVPASMLMMTGVGAQIAVQVSGSRSAEFSSTLATAWHRCMTSDSNVPSHCRTLTVSLRAHGEHPEPGIDVTSENADSLMQATTQAVTHAMIAAQTGRLLMFHAGVVAHPTTNRAVVYVAAGGTGKTTLTRLLATRYRYLTDETAGVDSRHRALPYPKPLSIRVPGNPHKAETPPQELCLLPAVGPALIARILLLDRSDSGPDRPDIQPLDLFDAILTLTPQTSALSTLDAGLHRLSDLIEATGPVLKVRYREAESLRPLIAELIGDPA